MSPRDRTVNLAILALAGLGWVVVGWILVNLDPTSDPSIRYAGAGALGLAFGLSVIPLFWLVGFARQSRIAYRGDWARAIRRGAWVGGLLAVVALLRMEGIFQPQIGLFLVALVIVAEVTISRR
jgi:hypothetical protein